MKSITILCLTAALGALAWTAAASAQTPAQTFANVYQMNVVAAYNGAYLFSVKPVPLDDIRGKDTLISWMDTTFGGHQATIYTFYILEKNDDFIKEFRSKLNITVDSYRNPAPVPDSLKHHRQSDPGIYPMNISASELGTTFTISDDSTSLDWESIDRFCNVNTGKAKVSKKMIDVTIFSFYIPSWTSGRLKQLRRKLTGE